MSPITHIGIPDDALLADVAASAAGQHLRILTNGHRTVLSPVVLNGWTEIRVRVTNPEDFEGTAQGWRAKGMNAEGVVVNVADGHWVTVRLDGPSQTEEDFTVNELTKRSPSSPHAHWRSASRSPRRSS